MDILTIVVQVLIGLGILAALYSIIMLWVNWPTGEDWPPDEEDDW